MAIEEKNIPDPSQASLQKMVNEAKRSSPYYDPKTHMLLLLCEISLGIMKELHVLNTHMEKIVGSASGKEK